MERKADRRLARAVVALAMLALVGLASGCSFLTSSEREYISNSEVLESAARTAGFRVDSNLYRITGLDLREDSMTCQYRGVAFPGDHAWVVKFSEKSSEQDPVALGDVYSLLPLIREGRERFEITEEGEREDLGMKFKFVRYRFDSRIRDGSGKPLAAHGIVVSLRAMGGGSPVVYHIKLDNHGDRDDVDWRDLRPFLESARP